MDNREGGGKGKTIGSRAQVWHGTAKKTSGGLTKSDLMKNKSGRIVSRAKHHTAKKEMRLVKHGYGTKKGKFGFVKMGSRKHRSRRMKGGMGMGPLAPADVNADYMISGVVPQEFTPLDRALVGGRRRRHRGGLLTGTAAGGRRSKRHRGGMPYGNNFNPADAMGSGIDGQGITDYAAAGSNSVQFAAGMAGGKRRKYRGGAVLL
jgi:hypothetical protein